MADLDEQRWAAVLRRDRTKDGRFVTGVLSTGIYCRPSCAARHPKRQNVRFFAGGEEARDFGLRPCLRCLPDQVAADEAGIARALALIETAEEAPSLDQLAIAAGYSPYHFHRLFRRATGVTPAAYIRAQRAKRAEQALKESDTVTEALYDAGYAAPARFYADMPDRLGMTPTKWRDGGRGETIRWGVAATDLGPLRRRDRAWHLPRRVRGGRCRITGLLPQCHDRTRRRSADGSDRRRDRLRRRARPRDDAAARRARHRVPAGGLARIVAHPSG